MARVKKSNTIEELAPELTPAVEVAEEVIIEEANTNEVVEETVKVEENTTMLDKIVKVETKKEVKANKAKTQSLANFLY